MRRQFLLPEDDVIFLDSLGLSWESINEGGMQWLLIHDFPVVDGYTQVSTTAAIKIETGYPRTQLDMAYFFPHLQRSDGQPIGALAHQAIDGKVYQRWSRHRTAANPWREGVDDLSTHVSLIKFWFEQEFQKRPNAVRT